MRHEYHNTPPGITTGTACVPRWSLQAWAIPPDEIYLDGPLDAIDYIPAGCVRYDNWGAQYPVKPYHQCQTVAWRGQ